MIAYFFCHLQVLLTPPDEGPRVKGQRIKLQDIVEGVYNPLSSNNGCWISCEWPFFIVETLSEVQRPWISHIISAEEFLYQNQWGEIALLSIVKNSTMSERILMSNTTYVSTVALAGRLLFGSLVRRHFNDITTGRSSRITPSFFWLFSCSLQAFFPSHTLISAEFSIHLCLLLRMRRVETTWRLAQKSVCCFLSR